MKDYHEKLTETRAISPSRYRGAVCAKHPELKGERAKKNYLCVGCTSEKRAERKRRPEVIEARRTAREILRVANLQEKKDIDATRQIALDIAISHGSIDYLPYWAEAVAKFRARTTK